MPKAMSLFLKRDLSDTSTQFMSCVVHNPLLHIVYAISKFRLLVSITCREKSKRGRLVDPTTAPTTKAGLRDANKTVSRILSRFFFQLSVTWRHFPEPLPDPNQVWVAAIVYIL